MGGFIDVSCFTVCTDFPMVSFIRCPVGKTGVVIGVKLAIRLAANLALFLCDAGGGAAGVRGFLYICVAIVASLPMVGFIRCPVGKVGVVTGIKLAIRLAADFALFLCGAGGSTAGVGGFFYICAAS